VSILHSRIIAQGAQAGMVASHPVVTPATPMVMPLARITYGASTGTGWYETLYPEQPASGDVNAVPLATLSPSQFGRVVPAGRP